MSKKNEAEMPENTGGFSFNNFIQGTKEELEKVVWPSRKQLVSESAAVLLMVTLSASLIYLVDGLFHWAATIIFKNQTVASLDLVNGLFAWAAKQVF
ncbi:MAG: preprotein translocase subunit SecE [Desmonostoc vinosum HA7617-LM4]|nr:preprotein translocase subunit SecE [Desmonostoc vinosum HA7617-LM4]